MFRVLDELRWFWFWMVWFSYLDSGFYRKIHHRVFVRASSVSSMFIGALWSSELIKEMVVVKIRGGDFEVIFDFSCNWYICVYVCVNVMKCFIKSDFMILREVLLFMVYSLDFHVFFFKSKFILWWLVVSRD